MTGLAGQGLLHLELKCTIPPRAAFSCCRCAVAALQKASPGTQVRAFPGQADSASPCSHRSPLVFADCCLLWGWPVSGRAAAECRVKVQHSCHRLPDGERPRCKLLTGPFLSSSVSVLYS